jgi:uncharacterized membrane protein YidH (DUF202 family)
MKPLTLLAILLIASGLITLAYQGIHYTTREKAIVIGPLQVSTEERHTIPLPPMVGILVVIGGIVLLVTSSKKS